jgi:hypothetical protein
MWHVWHSNAFIPHALIRLYLLRALQMRPLGNKILLIRPTLVLVTVWLGPMDSPKLEPVYSCFTLLMQPGRPLAELLRLGHAFGPLNELLLGKEHCKTILHPFFVRQQSLSSDLPTRRVEVAVFMEV